MDDAQLSKHVTDHLFVDLHYPPLTPLDDPTRIVKVVASDGKTGEPKEIQYTNCKVIGNGSFGVVFAARLLNVPKEEEEIAIKKVLQDKRFKVCLLPL